MLRSLHPKFCAVDDLVGLYHGDRRSVPNRPWVMLNMVASIDGATAVEGGSTGLSDEEDRSLFRVLRSVADVILVGSGTAKAENYRLPSLPEELVELRVSQGRSPNPRLAMVSGRLSLDPSARVFQGDSDRPIILTDAGVGPSRLAEFSDIAEVRGLSQLSGSGIVKRLNDFPIVLCEGGPSLNGQLVADGVVDEVNLSVAPVLVSGESARVAHGPLSTTTDELRLSRVLVGERMAFLRYSRPADGSEE